VLVGDELAALVAGAEVELLEAFDVDDEPPHPAMTRTAVTTTVDTTFEGFTLFPTAETTPEIARNGNLTAATTPSRPSPDCRVVTRPPMCR
jgi:hypothetical protein